jgi:hypothetical protein
MATIPYLLQMQVVLAGNGAGSLSFTVPNNEKLTLEDWIFSSTGVFSITGIRITGGNNISNAGANLAIPSSHLQLTGTNNNGIKKFPIPLVLEGGSTLYIDLVDTSGAGNTVKTTITGTRTV